MCARFRPRTQSILGALMRNTTRLFGMFASSLFCLPAVFAQTNPPPPDAHEMVTREPHTLTKPADRSAAINLLDRARKNYDLHSISTPYSLKVPFDTSGASQSEGAGTMEELYDGHSRWRWTEQLQDSHVFRVGAEGHTYAANPPTPLPVC